MLEIVNTLMDFTLRYETESLPLLPALAVWQALEELLGDGNRPLLLLELPAGRRLIVLLEDLVLGAQRGEDVDHPFLVRLMFLVDAVRELDLLLEYLDQLL